MDTSPRHLLSVPDSMRIAGAVLVCALGLVSLHRPDLEAWRAVIAFMVAWVYGASVIGRHLATATTR